MKRELIHNIFSPDRPVSLEDILEIFDFQYHNNAVYKAFTDALGVIPAKVNSIKNIPFLPIRFFKSHQITTTSFIPEAIYESSGTTGSVNSKHMVKDTEIYKKSFTEGFRLFYGDPADWCIIGLLPSYLDRKNSSLVVMADELIKMSGHGKSGFYLYEQEKLKKTLEQLENEGQKTLLIGVSFALLDFADKYSMSLKNTIIMETGGMKGRREEMIRQQMHAYLQERLGVQSIHSEYGMTELLSQAYSSGEGLFICPPWMKILLREEDDPLKIIVPDEAANGKPLSGLINVIDLANIYSCSFIATDDVGRLYSNGSFEVSGRMDNSDLRGCSLMVV